MLFRVIFLIVCLIIFLWAGYRIGNFDQKTTKPERISWSIIIILFTGLLVALVIDS